ncbi:MAG: asparagine synthase (glutamine-hydrolyzing) [Alphaproteobacteria bacterium]|nr:asparagine synthase (glutamine-hydrolyzing) [Alphaproteobacteria bacterium]
MCGIAGFQGAYDKDLLSRFNVRQAHRGPDDQDVWYDRDDRVGLAHRRLSIIDLSPEAAQPMCDASGDVQLVCNGEIYNFQALRRFLEGKGYRFKTHCDVEVLIHLYDLEGPDMLARLNGMYAFAIWDRRKKSLFLAADHSRIKPLYYAETPAGFVFASEIKALLDVPDLPREVNPEAIHYHLAYLWCPAGDTMLKAVRKCEPGQALLVRDGRIERSWTYEPPHYQAPIARLSEGDAIEALTREFEAAVERQMVSDVPVGAFLSGGLDSSLIVALMAQHTEAATLPCYTIKSAIGAHRGFVDDLPYAQKAAKHLGVKLNEIEITPPSADDLTSMIYMLDEPQADIAPINVLLIAAQARRDGVKVLLSGAGGDDVFSGYRRHIALGLERYWSWLPRPLRAALRSGSKLAPGGTGIGRRLQTAFRSADRPADERMMAAFFWSDPELRRSLYSGDLAASIGASNVLAPLTERFQRLGPDVPDLNRMLYLEQQFFLADHNLTYTDKASMAESIEVRVPFLDRELMQFAATLPVDLKLKGATTKYLLRKIAEPLLPHDVIYRPKVGFGAPIQEWLDDELSDVVEDALSHGSLKTRGWFEPKAVDKLRADNKAGKIDATMTIFELVCLELWARCFVDDRSLAAAA